MRIEATFLCRELPKDLAKQTHEKIEQGYLIDSIDPVRIRKKGNDYSFTRKTMVSPDDFSFRDYVSIPVDKAEFEKVWKLVIKKLTKTRYYYDLGLGSPSMRIDVFEGDLKGLILIEMIFNNDGELRSFVAPDWFGPEITKEKRLTNPAVAGKKFKALKPIIDEYLKTSN